LSTNLLSSLLSLIKMPAPQNRYFLLTIPQHDFVPWLPPTVAYIKGQLESGNEGGYLHWQLLAIFERKLTVTAVKNVFGRTAHVEPSRSQAADAYVWKEETRVAGTQFELGTKPFRRNSQTDWESVRVSAKRGALDGINHLIPYLHWLGIIISTALDIPADIFVRCYGQLRKIAEDYVEPTAIVREVYCYWGDAGTGKSRRAWEEAGLDAYPKCPRSKFWCGYRSHRHVVIDEFRGGIDVSHFLRWLDRYPVIVDTKGGATSLRAEKIWITSNLSPDEWFPGISQETLAAIRRRMTIVHYSRGLEPNPN